MEIAIKVLIGIIAFLHAYFLIFEMFFWTQRGPKVFSSFPKDIFEPSKALAANLGLYNGFLAAGLVWTFFISNPVWYENVALFFLSCVTIAGIYGAATAEKKIFIVQSIPAIIAGVLFFLN